MVSRRRSSLTTEARRQLALAGPVVLTGLNWTLMQVTDVSVVGAVSAHEAATLAASRSLTFVTVVTGLAWLSGILVAASRADGAGDLPRTGQVLREGLVLAVVLGVVLGAGSWLAAPVLLARLGIAADLIGSSSHVVRISAIGYPFQLALIAASFFLEGISRPGRVAAVNLAVLPLNAGLAWTLAGGHAGLPAWGAAGAAAATAAASAVGAAAMLWSAWRLPRADQRGIRSLDGAEWLAALRGTPTLARFGLVPAISSGLEIAGFSILIALSTRLGDTAAHAFQLVFACHNISFALAIGLASAAGVRAGNAVGAGDPGAAIGRTLLAIALTLAAMAAAAAAMLAGGGVLVALFPAPPAVHVLASAMLARWAPFILFDGVQVVLVYALRSLGDQVATGINSILAYFVVTGGVGWWLVGAGLGPAALVWASGAGMVAAALLHGARFGWVATRLDRPSLSRSGSVTPTSPPPRPRS